MKKLSLILTITVFILTGSLLNAQMVRDVIELKSGSVYKGQIVEEKPDSTIKLRAEDGMHYIFLKKDVRKITKETYTPVKEDIQQINLRYYYCQPEYSGVKQPTGIASVMIGINL